MQLPDSNRLNRKSEWLHILCAAATALVCILSIIVYSLSVRRDLSGEAQANIRDKALQSVRSVSQSIDSTFELLYIVSEQAAPLRTDFQDFLKDFAARNGFLAIYPVDENGRMHLSDGRAFQMKGVAEYDKALAGGEAVSPPYESGNRQIILFTIPMETPGGRQVLCALKDYRVFSDELLDGFYGGEGFVYIVDGGGKILFHSGSAPYHPSYQNLYTLLTTFIQGSDSTVEEMRGQIENHVSGVSALWGRDVNTQNFVEGYLGYEPVAGRTDWNVVYYIPTSVSARYSRNILIKSVLLILGLLAGVLLILFIILHNEKRRQREVQRLGDTDPLTGASRYDKFCRDAKRILLDNPGSHYAFFYSDVRGFKMLNDALGYETGDHVLRYIASVLREELGCDETFGRVSGDNFVVMRAYRDRKELQERHNKVYRRLESFEETRRQGFPVRVCSGVYCVEDMQESLSVSGMLDRANYAQKAIKSGGIESMAFYTEGIRDTLLMEKELENRMETALEQGEFEVYFQPKFDPATDRPAGAEALIRWRDPERGLLSPAIFIPLFERNRFIVRLDQYVFEEVCKFQARRVREGKPVVPISSNVSRLQLHNTNFVETYAAIRDCHRVPNGLLEVEFTESLILENIKSFRGVVSRLQELGFLCSLDDFGAEYSSLGLLGELSVDYLKLDGRFFRQEDDRERCDIVVKNVIAMAHQLRMGTVAEGIETREQLASLRRMGCDLVQGYVYEKPLPRREFEALLDKKDSAASPAAAAAAQG